MTDIAAPPEPREEEFAEPAAQTAKAVAVIPVLALAWAAAALTFILLRLGVIWHAPVGGAELVQLSGAWMARVGAPDDRFVPTLFQAITTLTLHWTDSATPARWIAFVSAASIPGAVFLLRRRMGDAGALLALLLLALDGLSIDLGSSASAMGFDLAITAWLFVAASRGGVRRWLWPLIGFAAASGGPMALPLVAAWAGVSLARRRYPPLTESLLCAAGVAVAVLLSTVRYGLGADGLRIAPFQLFADAYSQGWTSNTTFDLFLVFAAPVVLGGIASAGVATRRLWSTEDDEERSYQLLLLAWAGAAFLWAVSSFGSHSIVPLVALTTPAAFLLGPALVAALTALVRADWSWARFVIPVALFVALVYATAAAGWVQNNDTPAGIGVVVLAALVLFVLGCWWWLRQQPRAAATLLVIPIVVGAFPLIAGGLGVAFSGVGEPVPSPISPPQASELRNILEASIAKTGGPLVVDPSLWNDLTWPLRDSGNVVVASRVPADAGAAILPVGAPKPAGMNALQGQWNITQSIFAATANLSQYYHWFTNRGTAPTGEKTVAVYVKASP